MAKIVTDYTALEILKHAAKQELYDFHKVYVQTEPATEKVRGWILSHVPLHSVSLRPSVP